MSPPIFRPVNYFLHKREFDQFSNAAVVKADNVDAWVLDANPTGQPTIAAVGLGAMGGMLAAKLAQAGPVKVFDMDLAAAQRSADEYGTIPTSSLAEAVKDVDFLFTCMPNSKIVQAMCEQLTGKLKPGAIWVDCTSGDPKVTQALSAKIKKEHGVEFLDCAVSGGPAGAKAGTLTAMMGGPEESFDKVRPLVGKFAKKVVHIGGSGAGHAVKAINNTLLASNIWTVGEGLLALKKYGVLPSKALEAMNTSSGRSWVSMQRYPDHVVSRTWDYGFSLGLHAKDVDIGMSMLQETGVRAPVLRQVREQVQIGLQELGPRADHVEIVKLLERWASEDISDVLAGEPKGATEQVRALQTVKSAGVASKFAYPLAMVKRLSNWTGSGLVAVTLLGLVARAFHSRVASVSPLLQKALAWLSTFTSAWFVYKMLRISRPLVSKSVNLPIALSAHPIEHVATVGQCVQTRAPNDFPVVAAIGLGAMGGMLAGKLAQSGPVKVFDLNSDSVQQNADVYGTIPAASLEEAVKDADIFFTCMPNSKIVRAMLDSLGSGKIKRGAIWVDCTSGDPNVTRALSAEIARDHGAVFLDCAVSGGPAGAKAGTLTAMMGGPQESFDAVRPFVGQFAKNVVRMGDSGAGHAVKAINNTLLAANIWTVGEGLLALKKYGVAPTRALDAINTSSGRSWASMQRYPDHVVSRTFDYGFSLGLHAKDVDIGMSMLQTTGVRAPVLSQVREQMQIALQELGAKADHVEAIKLLERWAEDEISNEFAT